MYSCIWKPYGDCRLHHFQAQSKHEKDILLLREQHAQQMAFLASVGSTAADAGLAGKLMSK